MNIGGGEAADQLVRMMLSGGETTIRLGGSALKNLLALSLALARNHKRISGKVRLAKMLRETRDLRQFPMTPKQYRQFQKRAGKEKLLYSTIRDKDGRGRCFDVVLPVTELDRANQIFERIHYTPQQEAEPEREQKALNRPPKQRAPRRAQERHLEQDAPRQAQEQKPEQEAANWPQGRQPEENTAAPQETQPKKESRSEQDLHDTNASSSTAKEAMTTTNEKPSVERRLKQYQQQLQTQRRAAPARDKVKSPPKAR